MPFEHPVLQGLFYFVPFLLSLGVHEWAHAWTAWKLGDHTAKFLGRLTLNPIKHTDIFGTWVFPLMGLFLGIPFFGWARPVPVNPRNFKNPLRDMALVASAGPLSNLVIAVAFAALQAILLPWATPFHPVLTPLYALCQPTIWINIVLAFFNLIPLPPLDGSRILRYFLTGQTAVLYERAEALAPVLLLLIFFSGAIQILMIPAQAFYRFITQLF
jgi:Zn-dependent protease